MILTAFACVESRNSERRSQHPRYRRQFDTSNASQIDLNITVPYIFQARLYPYGQNQDDQLAQSEVQALKLQTPLTFLEKNYEIIYIHRDGFVTFNPDFGLQNPTKLPIPDSQIISVFWQRSHDMRVFFRESTDPNILGLAHSEVNIQYRYGNDFVVKSVIVITWEEGRSEKDSDAKAKNDNVFQIALILGENACFAHIVYSRLRLNGDNKPVAGLSGGYGENAYTFSLPSSGTADALQFIEKSNIGIPGEWLFRIDEERIYLCGAGFQGLECVDSCGPSQWYLDCSRICHCVDGNECNKETGECPDGKCNPGWEGSPTCDQDIDECAEANIECPNEQPDCVNTPGAYLCLCFEYDNATNTCKGSKPSSPTENIPVPVMPLVPLLVPSTSPRPTSRRIATSGVVTSDTDMPKPPAKLDISHFVGTIPSASFVPSEPLKVSTLSPMTIRPMLAPRKQPTPVSALPFPSPPSTPIVQSPVITHECQRCHQMAQCIDGRCICVPGWIGDGQRCEDLDECANNHACGLHAECQNTPGSYQCVCNTGFIATQNGCVDVDECADGLVQCHGGNSSMCVNTMGGYECRCRSGYTGTPDSAHGCVDVDECEVSQYYCGDKATCKNLPGAFQCECFEGYEKAPNSNHCVDMDECMHNPCHPAAVCTNFAGTFHCECADGFIGDGVECHETILYPIAKDALTISNMKDIMPVQLQEPLYLFGKSYSSAYVSANGIISFDGPIAEKLLRNPVEVHTPAFMPFHLSYNPATSGPILFQQISENSAKDENGLLTRASITIQSKYHDHEFRAKSLYIFTFERMRETNLEKSNTFQVAIAQGTNNVTYVTFLYENLESSPRGFAGITYPSGLVTVPTELLVSNSNVGQNGKWIFRIDGSGSTFTCPAGLQGPPVCQQDCPAGTWGFGCVLQCRCAGAMPCDFRNGYCANGKCLDGYTGTNCYDDVDECALEQHKCDPNATCSNTAGSYTCKCNSKYVGNGFNCEAVDECFMRFNSYCASNAHCDSTDIHYPECVCNDGFHGDGRRLCELNDIEPETTTSAKAVLLEVTNNKKVPDSESNENPFVMNNWITEETKQATSGHNTTEMPKHTTKIKTEIEHNDVDPEIYTSTSGQDSLTDTSGTMMILVPLVLFSIWVLLTVALILLCCCRRRPGRSDKFAPRTLGVSWNPRDINSRDYTSTRNSYFSQFSYT
ncbi:calcium-binding EGF domain-containing protein [Ditylenchus destructor]|uniref:Calcium-binding EGF domain-containing protein n=1 Tax=Ditylenchus destructor TaxID=166010 RepID=A0AAD4R7Y6_9BILA|nr:calcium-binding EGF domain-containing protein [Ditylenchus destructor]